MWLGELDYSARERLAVQHKRQIRSAAADQAEHERNKHRLLVGLAGRRRNVLRYIEAKAAGSSVVMRLYFDLRRSGLRIPAHELTHVTPAHIGEALHELPDGRRLAVMAREV